MAERSRRSIPNRIPSWCAGSSPAYSVIFDHEDKIVGFRNDLLGKNDSNSVKRGFYVEVRVIFLVCIYEIGFLNWFARY